MMTDEEKEAVFQLGAIVKRMDPSDPRLPNASAVLEDLKHKMVEEVLDGGGEEKSESPSEDLDSSPRPMSLEAAIQTVVSCISALSALEMKYSKELKLDDSLRAKLVSQRSAALATIARNLPEDSLKNLKF